MQAVTNDNFGPLIAYLVPGATVLAGLSNFSPTLESWFAIAPTESPSIGGFLFLTVAAIATGMTVSAIRWAAVDTLHAWTGLAIPSLDFSRLGTNVNAFVLLIEIHYRHYQFYANMLVATAIAYGCYRLSLGGDFGLRWIDVAFFSLELVFFATSRDTLSKYYARSQQLLSATLCGDTAPSEGNRQSSPAGITTSESEEPVPVAQRTPAASGPVSGKPFEAE
jgi:hypothetical protein